MGFPYRVPRCANWADIERWLAEADPEAVVNWVDEPVFGDYVPRAYSIAFTTAELRFRFAMTFNPF